MDPHIFLIQLLNGVQYGLLLFLVASGLTLIFGIMGVINLAHGSFYMLGAYLAWSLTAQLGNFWLALLAGFVLSVIGTQLLPEFFSVPHSSYEGQQNSISPMSKCAPPISAVASVLIWKILYGIVRSTAQQGRSSRTSDDLIVRRATQQKHGEKKPLENSGRLLMVVLLVLKYHYVTWQTHRTRQSVDSHPRNGRTSTGPATTRLCPRVPRLATFSPATPRIASFL